MTKSFIPRVLLLAGAMLVAGTAPSSTAATLTYNDPNCAGFQITGSGGSFTLTCAKLQCSICRPHQSDDRAEHLAHRDLSHRRAPLISGVSSPVRSATSTCNAPSSPTSATTAINKPTGIVAGQTRSCLYQVNGTAAPTLRAGDGHGDVDRRRSSWRRRAARRAP